MKGLGSLMERVKTPIRDSAKHEKLFMLKQKVVRYSIESCQTQARKVLRKAQSQNERLRRRNDVMEGLGGICL